MSTKPSLTTQEFPSTSPEKIAYESVGNIPVREMNDRNRLGFHIWRWIKNRRGSIEEAVKESGARLEIPTDQAAKIVREALEQRGIKVGM